ncbi:MAG: YihA family ribosome biogenesis GTP-binding protein [Clostridiales bacterium]|nr:YihA family ribosome biogenesis GTP-binding protein [Clostridiales bacterium]
MEIKNVKFITSVADSRKMIVDEKHQVAFVGRSNVGKSSLINMLLKHNKLAKTSSTPGRTRLINYFQANEDVYFVDLPGYGYAKASKKEVDGWQGMIEPYLIENEQLKCVCMLVDSRYEPTAQDKQMLKFLNYYQIPFIIIATKCDKFGKSQVKPQMVKIANYLGVGKDNVFPSSGDTGYGRLEILNKLDQFLSENNDFE